MGAEMKRHLPGEEQLDHVHQGVFSRFPEELCQHTIKQASEAQKQESNVRWWSRDPPPVSDSPLSRISKQILKQDCMISQTDSLVR